MRKPIKQLISLIDQGGLAGRIDEIQEQYMGLLKFSTQGQKMSQKFLISKKSAEIFKLNKTTLLNKIVKIEGNWMEVDSSFNLKLCAQILDRRKLILDEQGEANGIL